MSAVEGHSCGLHCVSAGTFLLVSNELINSHKNKTVSKKREREREGAVLAQGTERPRVRLAQGEAGFKAQMLSRTP